MFFKWYVRKQRAFLWLFRPCFFLWSWSQRCVYETKRCCIMYANVRVQVCLFVQLQIFKKKRMTQSVWKNVNGAFMNFQWTRNIKMSKERTLLNPWISCSRTIQIHTSTMSSVTRWLQFDWAQVNWTQVLRRLICYIYLPSVKFKTKQSRCSWLFPSGARVVDCFFFFNLFIYFIFVLPEKSHWD